jgi:hypothetical protein
VENEDCERCRDGAVKDGAVSVSSDIALFDRLKKLVMAPWPFASGLTDFARAGFASAFLESL